MIFSPCVRGAVLLLGCVAGLLLPSELPAQSFPGADAKWRRYESPHFELYSRAGDRESRTLLHHLELLRIFAVQTLGLRERMPREVTIYYFSRQTELEAYVPDRGNRKGRPVAGYHSHYPDRDVIMLTASNGMEMALEMIQHSYVQHLLAITGRPAPRWLQSGAGLLFSTVEPRGEKLLWGRADAFRTQKAKDVSSFSVGRVFATQALMRGQEAADIFHAEAWGLMHWLYLGETDIPRARVDAFMQHVLEGGAGTDGDRLQQAFQEKLGIGYEEADRRVTRYLRGGHFPEQRVARPALAGPESYAVRPVPAEEAHERLAELALRMQRSPEARLLLLQAAGRSGAGARVHEVLGLDALLEGESDRAMERWTRAIEAGSTNPAIFHQVGLRESARWFRQFDVYFRLAPDVADRLRRMLVRSIERAPDQASAYEWLAWVEATAPTPDMAKVNLVQSKFSTLENQTRTLLAFALLRARLNDPAANEILEAIKAADDSAGMRRAVKMVRAYLDRPPVADPP